MAKSKLDIPIINRLKEKIQEFKGVISHFGLYIGLVLYTAIGAWVKENERKNATTISRGFGFLFQIFILIEHPVEKEKLDDLQVELQYKREGFLSLVKIN